jgi:hypothetical protein
MKRSLDRTASPIAAAVVVAAVLTTACSAGQGVASATPETAPRASATPAPSVATSPAVASSSASASAAALTWTQASLSEDWPAPVRAEPAGGASVVPTPKVWVDGKLDPKIMHIDPTGDTGSAVLPWVDIRGVRFCGISCLTPDLVTHDRPIVDPVEQWMAYGVVFDTDRDGVADWRYGVDNLPIDPSGWAANADSEQMVRDELAIGAAPFRAWRTDLHTGRTEWTAGPPYQMVGKTHFGDSWTRFRFGGDSTGGFVGERLDMPFYVWTSVIMDGRVVATDYAPDVGWILPSPDANP